MQNVIIIKHYTTKNTQVQKKNFENIALLKYLEGLCYRK